MDGVGELHQRRSVIVTLYRSPPHQDSERAGKAGNRFAHDGVVSLGGIVLVAVAD
jgi:hypothetical protein